MQGKVEICGVNTSKLPVLKNEETRRLLEKELSPVWRKFVIIDENMRKLTLKEKYKPAVVKRGKIRSRRRRLDKTALSAAAA